MITHLLFDLDNTLYSSRYGLENNVSQRINDFIVEVMGLPRPEVEEIRKEVAQNHKYGTTLEWLMAEKGFSDIEAYYGAINAGNDYDSLPPDPELDDFLATIPLPKAVLTNSCIEHAERVLAKLGIRGRFSHVFDIRFNNYKGKPRKEVYLRALEAMGAKPESCLFVDDYTKFVDGYLALGGKALLMDEFDQRPNYPHPRIKNIQEIEKYISIEDISG